jgi:hypothetical protein
MSNTIQFDVFLSHNSQEKPYVEEIATWLRTQNMRVWYDKWELRPGMPWQQELEQGILNSIAVIICIGKSGLGTWHEPEMRAAIGESMKRKCPVIPVLLPGCPADVDLPLFLQDRTWVDFRHGLDNEDARGKLLWGLTGRNPYQDRETGVQSLVRPLPPSADLKKRMLEGKNRRLKRQLEGLEKQEELLSEKIQYLQAAFLIETAPAHKFQMKKQLEEAEAELTGIQDKIDDLYQQAEQLSANPTN